MPKVTAQIPRNSEGKILWSRVTGFARWFKSAAPKSTQDELAALFQTRYGVEISSPALESLRRTYRANQNADTLARGKAAAQPPETPAEKYDRETLTAAVRRLSSRDTMWEVIGEKVISAVKSMDRQLPKITPPVIKLPSKMHEEEAVLVISDVQAGSKTSARETGGLGEFNTEILLKQIDYLGDAIQSIMKYHTNVKRLNVLFNGDIVEGETIFRGQQREIDMNLVEQIVFCKENFGRFLMRMAQTFEHVHCTGTVGNHGRLGMKGEHSPMSNFDYLTYKWLEERTRPIENISWTIPDTWWLISDIMGWRFLQVHGDDTGQSTWGIPFYGMSRHSSRYQEMLRLGRQKGFDYIVLGHHSVEAQFQNVISAGSWPGGTEFSIKGMQAAGVPSAPFFGVDERFGKTWRRDIQLRPPVAR
jgi:hypothetical protein